ncbi:MAG: hypothetical protein JXB13_18355, partial [Phycisphaerae bacterium]|nr:hypothetical protein [Phycisphaerae bacterium]
RVMPEKPAAALSPFVTVDSRNGRWWFIRNGEPFLDLGVNVVLPGYDARVPDAPRYDVLPRYGGDVAAWANSVVERLRAWHFTTVAAWSHDYLYTNSPMYHTRVVSFGPWGEKGEMRLVDVFSPEYAAEADATASREVAPHAQNPHLIGYFLGNELPWYGLWGWPTDPDISLLTRYCQLPEGAEGKLRLAGFLRDAYTNDFAAFSRQWDSKAESFDDLLRQRRLRPRSPVAKKLAAEWAGIVAEQYFKVCAEAVRRYDPNHLILGCRFAGRAQVPVLAACGKYADVVSVNHYRKTGIFDTAEVGAIAALTQRPVMITEFSFRAMENSSGCTNTHGADVTVQTQQDRADAFRRYATAALEQPYLVGYDWFQYADQSPMGRFDGEDSNYGLVDIHDQPYTALLAAVSEINGRAREIHADSTITMPACDPGALVDYREITVRSSGAGLAEPLVWTDARSTITTYGDQGNPGSVEIVETESGRVLHVHTGSGWGCGITARPPRADYPDGSASIMGASRVVVRLRGSRAFRFNFGLNESGHGAVNAQTFGGYGHADGEAYVHAVEDGQEGWREYSFDLSELDLHAYYGNQRGNSTVDTDAIAEFGLYFPGGQGDFDLALDFIRVE